MRYQVRKSVIDVVGKIWMPNVTASMRLEPSSYDVENMRDEDGAITRDSVEDWLGSHAGDFRSVIDFAASIEDGDSTIDLPWATEDGEFAYLDTFPCED